LDQRKFITFMLLTMAIWMLSFKLFPVPELPDPAAAGAKDDGKAADAKAEAAAEDADADNAKDDAEPAEGEPQPPAEGQPQAGQAAPEGAQPPAPRPGELVIAQPAGETEYVSIGSLEPKDGYRMLVTLTSRGAAVLRAELSSPRFSDQQNWSGYLGELQL
jgi:hypothetical protein